MTANTATEHTAKVIPLTRPEAVPVVVPEKATGHVFSGQNGEKGRRGGVSDTRRGEDKVNDEAEPNAAEPVAVAERLSQLLEKLACERAAINYKCRQVAAEILTHPEMAHKLLEHIKATDASNSITRYAQGIDALLAHFDAGAAVKTGELADVAATETLAARFLRDQVKDVMVEFDLLKKQENGQFCWATYPQLQVAHLQLYPTKPANDLQMETTDLQMTCNRPANGNAAPANGLQLICKRLAVNPLVKVRDWQRTQYVKRAQNNAWVKYDASTNTIEVLGNEYDPKDKRVARSEKAKELIRLAETAEAKAKLQSKVDAANNKKLMQEISNIGLESQREQAMMMAESIRKAAILRAQRAERNERLAGYRPVFITAGIAAAILFLYANGDTSSTNQNTYPVEMATMPAPGQGE